MAREFPRRFPQLRGRRMVCRTEPNSRRSCPTRPWARDGKQRRGPTGSPSCFKAAVECHSQLSRLCIDGFMPAALRVDLHQHVWTTPLLTALQRRGRFPYIRRTDGLDRPAQRRRAAVPDRSRRGVAVAPGRPAAARRPRPRAGRHLAPDRDRMPAPRRGRSPHRGPSRGGGATWPGIWRVGPAGARRA